MRITQIMPAPEKLVILHANLSERGKYTVSRIVALALLDPDHPENFERNTVVSVSAADTGLTEYDEECAGFIGYAFLEEVNEHPEIFEERANQSFDLYSKIDKAKR